jgi:hypothetical protein
MLVTFALRAKDLQHTEAHYVAAIKQIAQLWAQIAANLAFVLALEPARMKPAVAAMSLLESACLPLLFPFLLLVCCAPQCMANCYWSITAT